MAKLTKRAIDALEASDQDRIAWDSDLKGFGVRVSPAGVKSFLVQYRNHVGRSRRITISRVGVLTVDEARAKARELLVLVAKGGDPAGDRQALRAAPTVDDLLNRYLEDHVAVHNKNSTRRVVEDLLDKHIRPRLGHRKAVDVAREDIEQLHQAMGTTPRAANHALAVLSKAFNLAEIWRMRAQNSNPTRGVRRYRENARERFLAADELARLGQSLALSASEGLPWRIDEDAPASKHVPKVRRVTPIDPIALAVIKTLLFSGGRLSEILQLQWAHVDSRGQTLAMPGVKGGERQPHPVGAAVFDVIASLPKPGKGEVWVFPRTADRARHISKEVVENAWQRIRDHAGIPDVRLHDLRHTVGTYASNSGVNAFVVRDLLRHKGVAMTGRYVNKSDGPVKSISDAVSSAIASAMSNNKRDQAE